MNVLRVEKGTIYMRFIFAGLIILCASVYLTAQADTVRLVNGSFEGQPMASRTPYGWVDCGFKGETPPDIQPSGTFMVTREAYEGNTYLGMVVRDNDTWERVSQRLTTPIQAGTCYSFTIYLCRSSVYLSPDPSSSALQGRDIPQIKPKSYTQPAVLRLWGGSGYCSQRELLGETPTVENTNWQAYTLTFEPSQTHSYFELEAFYKTPTLLPYNGNLLIDHASPLVPVPCPGDPIAAHKPNQVEKKTSPQQIQVPKKQTQPAPPKPIESVEMAKIPTGPQEKIIKELDRKTIKEGQTIRIEKLYFKADSSSVEPDSYSVLEEIYHFLNENREVIVEIGGHTNGRPPHEFCDQLSAARAQAVADYLLSRGIDASRLQVKGYGKRNPIASNKTLEGRQKNQRVEIKILSLEG
jgi:outer membrane protein OmpA-like peptidoglycan-associated protein